MNLLHGDEDFTEEQLRRRMLKRRILFLTAFILALLFFVSLFAGGLRVLGGVSFKLLLESWSLSRDPVIAELREAVVKVETMGPGGGSSGTGFNLDPSGLIVTNSHLIENAISITVTFPGLANYQAVSWKSAVEADLAVISLKQDNLPVVELETGALPAPGDTITIIGNPKQLSGIIVLGQVEGYGRLAGSDKTIMGVDAPIQPGHSGSPVFNASGKVAAVIFAVADREESAERIGLALPADIVFDFMNKR